MWARLMLLAFVANGLGPFGLKILAEHSLAGSFHYHYLAAWYGAGFVLALGALLFLRLRPRRVELLYAAGIGLASFGGQLFTSLALECGVPGHIAFPITTGGSLVFVVAGGLVLFREPISWYGVAGLASGIGALVLLSL